LQRLQNYPPERRPLARGAQTRRTMQIAGDTPYAIRPGTRVAIVILIHGGFSLGGSGERLDLLVPGRSYEHILYFLYKIWR